MQAILAGNVFHRAVLLGPARGERGGPPAVRVLVNGEQRASTTAPDDYYAGVLELTGRLLGEAGESLRPGDRVICGVIGAPLPAAPGDDVTVEFGQLGRLNVRIAD